MRIALVAVVVNIALKLILMGPLAQVGVALATSFSSWINAALLALALRRRGFWQGGRTAEAGGCRAWRWPASAWRARSTRPSCSPAPWLQAALGAGSGSPAWPAIRERRRDRQGRQGQGQRSAASCAASSSGALYAAELLAAPWLCQAALLGWQRLAGMAIVLAVGRRRCVLALAVRLIVPAELRALLKRARSWKAESSLSGALIAESTFTLGG